MLILIPSLFCRSSNLSPQEKAPPGYPSRPAALPSYWTAFTTTRALRAGASRLTSRELRQKVNGDAHDHPPERGPDTEQRHARGREHEGQQACLRVVGRKHRTGKFQDRLQKRQAGQKRDQGPRQQDQNLDDAAGKKPAEAEKDATGDASNVSAVGGFMAVGTGAKGRRVTICCRC